MGTVTRIPLKITKRYSLTNTSWKLDQFMSLSTKKGSENFPTGALP